MSDRSCGRLLVNEYPFGSGIKLQHSFVIFFLPQRPRYAVEENRNRAVGMYSSGIDRNYYGNILVMKMGTRKPVISVQKMDYRLVDNIVARWFRLCIALLFR